jgi:hypothetical protein
MGLKTQHSLHQYLVQRIPDACDTGLTNLIWLMMGMFQSGSVQLNLVARKTPVRAKKLSIVKRFERFLNNAVGRVRPWYPPFAQAVVAGAASAGQVHLIIDASKVAVGVRLVMVSVAYHDAVAEFIIRQPGLQKTRHEFWPWERPLSLPLWLVRESHR